MSDNPNIIRIDGPNKIVYSPRQSIVKTEETQTQIISSPNQSVINTTGPKQVIQTAKQGPPGPRGADGDNAGLVEKTYQAAEPTSSGKVVKLDSNGQVLAADTTDVDDRNRIIGVSKTSAGFIGADIIVVQLGEVEDPAFNFTDLDNPVFFDALGIPVQAVPAVGFQLIVGFPISAMRLYVNIRQPIILS